MEGGERELDTQMSFGVARRDEPDQCFRRSRGGAGIQREEPVLGEGEERLEEDVAQALPAAPRDARLRRRSSGHAVAHGLDGLYQIARRV